MQVTNYNAQESDVGTLEDILKKSKEQDDLGRTNYTLFGSIDDHPLKDILNEMEDVTAPAIKKLHSDCDSKYNLSADKYNICMRVMLYIEPKKKSVLLHLVTIVSTNEKNTYTDEKVKQGFSIYSTELEKKDGKVIKKDEMWFEKFISKSLPTKEIASDKVSSLLKTIINAYSYFIDGKTLSDNDYSTSDKKEVLKNVFIHEISANSSTEHKNPFINILRSFPALLQEKDFSSQNEKSLFKKYYNEASGVLPNTSINIKYTLSYLGSNIFSILLTILAAIKVHLMQYFVINLPSFLSIISVTLASGYISSIAMIASIFVCLLSYGGLNYIAYRELAILYGENYKSFCKKISIINLFKSIFILFNHYLNVTAARINQFIALTMANFVGSIRAYYKLEESQIVADIKNLNNLIFRHAAMRLIQNIMLLSSFLCLLLPSYQLVSAISVLVVYFVFSYSCVTPNNVSIVRETGSNNKAVAACELFGVTTSGVDSYNVVKDFLGYKDLEKHKQLKVL